MFGYDERTLERVRERSRRPRANRVVVAAELAALVVGLALCVLFWSFTTREGLQRVFNHLVGDAPVTVTLGDVDVVPWSRPLDPSTWRLCLTDVVVTPDNPETPRFSVDRLVVSMPELIRAWATRHLKFQAIVAYGLDVRVPRQRAPAPWTPHRTALALLSADRVVLSGGHVHVDEDGPLGLVDSDEIRGVLQDVEFAPGSRDLSGTGELSARSFQMGNMLLRGVQVREITATKSNLAFSGASFRFAGGDGLIGGRILDLNRRPAVLLEATLTHTRAEDVFASAVGKASPISGLLDAHLTIHAGGDLARGDAWMEGTAKLAGGKVPLGPGVRQTVVDLLRIAPYIDVSAANEVLLGDMTGEIRLRRGLVEIEKLDYAAPRRTLELHGSIDQGDYDLVLRLVPDHDADTRPGVGIVLQGTKNNLKLRLAHPEELIDAPAAAPRRPRLRHARGDDGPDTDAAVADPGDR